MTELSPTCHSPFLKGLEQQLDLSRSRFQTIQVHFGQTCQCNSVSHFKLTFKSTAAALQVVPRYCRGAGWKVRQSGEVSVFLCSCNSPVVMWAWHWHMKRLVLPTWHLASVKSSQITSVTVRLSTQITGLGPELMPASGNQIGTRRAGHMMPFLHQRQNTYRDPNCTLVYWNTFERESAWKASNNKIKKQWSKDECKHDGTPYCSYSSSCANSISILADPRVSVG